jgi:trypsin
MSSRSARSTPATTATSSGWTEREGRNAALGQSRRHLILLAAIAGVCTLLAGATAAPAAPRAQRSVVGGGRADPAQWRYAVAIFRKGHLHCGGSVIGPSRVLTAGHCVNGFNLASFQVIVGRPNLRDASVGQSIGVASGRVHPDFEQTGLHDVAILDLAQPAGVTPVPLATPEVNDATTFAGARLQVAGYGATNPFGAHLSPFLKSTVELARSPRRCLRTYTRDLFASESMICALGKKRKRPGRFKIHTSACSGDSGGPLVAATPTGPVEVGTVSYGGALCGYPGSPTVYSRVSSSLDFLEAP